MIFRLWVGSNQRGNVTKRGVGIPKNTHFKDQQACFLALRITDNEIPNAADTQAADPPKVISCLTTKCPRQQNTIDPIKTFRKPNTLFFIVYSFRIGISYNKLQQDFQTSLDDQWLRNR